MKNTNLQNKKIIFLGNLNNFPFEYARELKKREFDVTFIIDTHKENALERPEFFVKEFANNYPAWIKEMILKANLKAFKFALPVFYLKKYINLINQYDIIFLNGLWISLAKYIKPGKTAVALFAGFDLDILANLGSAGYLTESFYQESTSGIKKVLPRFIPRLLFKKLILLQRQGIKRTDIVNYYTTGINPASDKLLNEIKAGQKFKRFEQRGFDCSKFPYHEPLQGSKKFTILNVTRFFYLNKRNDNKRNDIMIKGIGGFLKNNNVTPEDVEIFFFEKGDDVEDAKKMCHEYGLTPFVKWNRQISAEELNNYFVRCDVAFDQLGVQWIGAGLFSMLTGRPVIANERPDVFEKLFKEKSPVCQATNEQEVEMWLTKLYHERHLIKEIGIASRDYVLCHYNVTDRIDDFIKYMES